MPLISKVGRRRMNVRITLAGIALLLLLGSTTMLYPLALMLAGSMKSNADVTEKSPIPSFLVSDTALWKKHVEGLFNESPAFLQSVYQTPDTSGNDSEVKPVNEAFVAAWSDFLNERDPPPYCYAVGFLHAPLTPATLPKHYRAFRQELISQFDGNISALNAAFGTEFFDWGSLLVLPPQYLRRGQRYDDLPLSVLVRDYCRRQPIGERVYVSVEGFYRTQYLKPLFATIEQYNAHHQTAYASFLDIPLARTADDAALRTPAERETWERFVRTTLNLLWIEAGPEAIQPYRTFLQSKYLTIDALNRGYASQYASFGRVELPAADAVGLRSADFDEFVQGWRDPGGVVHALPVAALRVQCVDFDFRDALARRYGTIAQCNAALGTQFNSFASVVAPQQMLHEAEFSRQRGAVRWEFATRNYVAVADYLLVRGRAAWNTVLYCGLAVLGALTVNPLAAYALSRYRPRSTYLILLLLMLTMAFPPMVTQIPVFLLMRDLGLLNTLWALVLPGLANGYSIFLLKGFFDSLPQELYESASLDGASELRIFWQITISLSKPILAVVALAAFTAAYSNFMFALLLCQDRSAWTLMVWLYQLQARASEGVILAALTLAAIPTLIVFALAQRQIMQGIVVPVEK